MRLTVEQYEITVTELGVLVVLEKDHEEWNMVEPGLFPDVIIALMEALQKTRDSVEIIKGIRNKLGEERNELRRQLENKKHDLNTSTIACIGLKERLEKAQDRIEKLLRSVQEARDKVQLRDELLSKIKLELDAEEEEENTALLDSIKHLKDTNNRLRGSVAERDEEN